MVREGLHCGRGAEATIAAAAMLMPMTVSRLTLGGSLAILRVIFVLHSFAVSRLSVRVQLCGVSPWRSRTAGGTLATVEAMQELGARGGRPFSAAAVTAGWVQVGRGGCSIA